MRIAICQRRIESDVTEALIDTIVDIVAFQQLQRLRQRATQAVTWMQRGIRILKHHLHFLTQCAGKGFARLNLVTGKLHLALPVWIETCQHPQQRRLAAA